MLRNFADHREDRELYKREVLSTHSIAAGKAVHRRDNQLQGIACPFSDFLNRN